MESENIDWIKLQLTQAQQVARTEVLVSELHSRLFGSAGQQGQIDRIDKHLEATDARVDSLEDYRWFIKGGAVIVGMLGTALTAVLAWLGWPHAKDIFK